MSPKSSFLRVNFFDKYVSDILQMLLYKLNIHTKYLQIEQVKIVLNKAKILQIITFFSEKVSQKVHKLLRQECKNSLCQLRSTTGGSLGENGNFPGITDHLTFLENCRLTTLLSKIWLRNWQMFFYTFVRFRKIIFYGLILPQIFNIKSFLNTPANIKENEKNLNAKKK